MILHINKKIKTLYNINMYSDLEITTFPPHIKFQNIKEIILSNLDSIKKYIPLEITNHHQLPKLHSSNNP